MKIYCYSVLSLCSFKLLNSYFSRRYSNIDRFVGANNNIIDFENNIKWTSYIAPVSKNIIKIAEIIDIDPIFNYTCEQNLPEPFGIVTWESSYTAADIMDLEYSSLQGKTICDLGCGTGLTSLLCLSMGAEVHALDFNELSLSLLNKSLELYLTENNTSNDKLTDDLKLNLRNFDMTSALLLPRCDLLIISDVTYYDSLAEIVSKRIYEAIKNFNCRVLITDPGRISSSKLLIKVLKTEFIDMKLQIPDSFQPYEVKGITKGYYMWLN